MVAFREYVSAPAFTSRPFGLLSTLRTETRNPTNRHWQAGVTYEPLCAVASTTYDACFAVTGSGSAPAPPAPAKSETSQLTKRGATSFTVYSTVDCSAPGFWERLEELRDRALTEAEHYQVERAFWTGTAAGQPVVYPHLAANAAVTDDAGVTLQTAATVVVSGAVALDIVEALGRLEATLGDCYDGVGVIHVPLVLAPALANANLLIRDGFRYRTPTGNVIVLGAGYTGSSPAGVSSGASAWMYATGAMFVYKGDLEVVSGRESINRATNNLRTLAERTFVIGWECCHIAVNVSTGGVVAGAAGTSS